MSAGSPAYGLWSLVIINTAVFAIFAFSFTRPRTGRDWRSFGAFTAFLVALFTEMYGFPLTIYLLSGWLQRRYPRLDLLTHDAGHLWETLLGWRGDPHLNPLHVLSSVLIGSGCVLLAAAWRVLFAAQQARHLATTGPYAYVRHLQYVGFILIMLGFLLQWPTLLTLAMFPILVWMYVRLARNMGGKDCGRGPRLPDARDRVLPVRRRPCRDGRRPLLPRPLRRPRPLLVRRYAPWPCCGLADLSHSRSTAPRPLASPPGSTSEASPRFLVALPVCLKGERVWELATLWKPPIPMLPCQPGHGGHGVRDGG